MTRRDERVNEIGEEDEEEARRRSAQVMEVNDNVMHNNSKQRTNIQHPAGGTRIVESAIYLVPRQTLSEMIVLPLYCPLYRPRVH